jgi:hypothetical protein
MRHGGAFVVVPDVAAAPISFKYPVEPFDLGDELRQTWLSLFRIWSALKGGNTDRVPDVIEQKRLRTHKLCSAARSVGHLSATDGCVVFDRNLVLHGFGGSINAREVPAKSCVRVVGRTQEDISEEELLRPFGKRHTSAYQLCRQVPDSLVFVISQDGDLRVFASDESTVYLYDLLHA